MPEAMWRHVLEVLEEAGFCDHAHACRRNVAMIQHNMSMHAFFTHLKTC
jgi:hypothetical protein